MSFSQFWSSLFFLFLSLSFSFLLFLSLSFSFFLFLSLSFCSVLLVYWKCIPSANELLIDTTAGTHLRPWACYCYQTKGFFTQTIIIGLQMIQQWLNNYWTTNASAMTKQLLDYDCFRMITNNWKLLSDPYEAKNCLSLISIFGKSIFFWILTMVRVKLHLKISFFPNHWINITDALSRDGITL